MNDAGQDPGGAGGPNRPLGGGGQGGPVGVGWVALVGAGPGDAGLLTCRGKELMQRADVIFYDHLASQAVLASVEVSGQERVHVGKSAGKVYASQASINDLLVRRALAGQNVVRLKGGDPFVFGRGGEEALALVEHGIPVEIVPGVSSIAAVPAAAGIPVTHRDHASTLIAVTGHPRADGRFDPNAPGVDWPRLAAIDATLVIFMGLGQRATWSAELMAAGKSPETPVAFIASGTLPRQKVVLTTLADAVSAAAMLHSPVVAVVGPVASLHASLGLGAGRPLTGLVIGLTRDVDDGPAFDALRRQGATLYPVPLTRKVPAPESISLPAFLRSGAHTDLVLTSANAAAAVSAVIAEAGLDARSFAGMRTWAVGEATARAMRTHLGLGADLLPHVASAEGLLALADTVGVAGRSFLFPAARGAGRLLPEGLCARGATVAEVVMYETVPDPGAPTRLQAALADGMRIVALASPSAAEAFAAALDTLEVPRETLPVAAIGPTTATAAAALGLRVEVVPHRYAMDALAEAVGHWWQAADRLAPSA